MKRILAAAALLAGITVLPVALGTASAQPAGCMAKQYVSSHQTSSYCTGGTGSLAAQQYCVIGEASQWVTGNWVSRGGTSVTGWCTSVLSRRTAVSG